MPKQITDQIVEQLAAGDRVLVVADDPPAALHAIAELASVKPGVRIFRANGAERVSHPSGGVVFIRSARGHGHRGVAVDLVVLVVSVTTTGPHVDRLLDEVMPCVLPHGDLRVARAA